MIDIHTHILPAIDDGARDLEESLAMARLAVERGLTKVVATPHVARFGYFPAADEIREKVAEMNLALAKENIPLEILTGAEYLLEPDLAERAEKNQVVTINDRGRHILVELPETMVPHYTEEVLYALQLTGLTPVLAHPERNRALMEKPDFLQELVRRGVLLQVTTGSVTGIFGGEVQKNSFRLIQRGMVHFIASDAHSTGRRSPGTMQAASEIRKRWGEETAARLLYQNPQTLIEGREIEGREQEGREGVLKKLFGYFG